MSNPSAQPHAIVLDTGLTAWVDVVTPQVFRVRIGPGPQPPEGALNRYGILTTDFPPVVTQITEAEGSVRFSTGEATVAVRRADGFAVLSGADGEALARCTSSAAGGDGFSLSIALGAEERLYGLGDESRDRLDKRGHKADMVLRNVAAYAPIPFLMSTGGWAVLVNTTWFHHWDIGATDPDTLRIHSRHGALDFYLFAGDSLPELLDQYTRLSGRPALLPQWAYGLTWVCDERGVRARDVLYEALMFRREGIPCDVIGLEPDWMDKHYDFSVDKQWSTERFHEPFWMPHQRPGGFTKALDNMGFKLSLWLCCDYDLSEHEERELGGPGTAAEADTVGDDRYEEDIIRDPHFTAVHHDSITRPGEPWFSHLRKFVDNGARAFKMDGANQVCFHPDRRWHNGMADEEMHNLYPLLLAKQMSRGFTEHCGQRAMVYTAGGYAGVQQYAATWAGDTGGSEKPLASLLNHGLSGHSNTSCDMQVWNLPGMHFGFLQPWSQILCWHQYNQPWFLPPDVYEAFRFYARLRYTLLPYLYSAAHVAARSGLPVMRAMPLCAPEDRRCDNLLLQYMLGDSLLTCAFTDTIYLPAGEWIDYWTGETLQGPRELRYQPPAGRGGPLFVKSGAILPTWPEVDYVGQRPMETLGLEVFAGSDGEFTLYEDDGLTPAYLEGQVAVTRIQSKVTEGKVVLTIGPREGGYEGMPGVRCWDLSVHLARAPREVRVNGATRVRDDGPDGWRVEEQGRLLRLTVSEDPSRQKAAVVEVEL